MAKRKKNKKSSIEKQLKTIEDEEKVIEAEEQVIEDRQAVLRTLEELGLMRWKSYYILTAGAILLLALTFVTALWVMNEQVTESNIMLTDIKQELTGTSVKMGVMAESVASGVGMAENKTYAVLVAPPNCPEDVCNEEEFQELQDAGLSVLQMDTVEQYFTGPLMMVSKDGSTTISLVTNRAEVLKSLCESTDNEFVCESQAEAAAEAESEKCKSVPKADVPEIEMFVMSYCPFGQQAESGLIPVARALGDSINLVPKFIVSKQGDSYRSLHGEPELNEDIRQMCVYKYYEDKIWDYIEKINAQCSLGNIETCWETQAEAVGIDVSKIKTCQQDEGNALLDAEIEATSKYGVTGSPTVIVNGQKYSGGRAPEDYKSYICCAFNDKPEACDTKLGETTGAASGSC